MIEQVPSPKKESLIELYSSQPELFSTVYTLEWEGATWDIFLIVKYKNLYLNDGDEGVSGPFTSFEEALANGYNFITEAAIEITCTELSSDELVDRLDFEILSKDFKVKINDQTWKLNDSGRLERIE